MSKKMAGILILYGVVLAGLAFLVENRAPGRITVITGWVGGGLSLLWGLAALVGLKGRVWATLTIIAIIAVLLSQVVHVWTSSASEGTANLTGRWGVTTMLLGSIALLAYLLHAERPPEFYANQVIRPSDSSTTPNVAAPKARRGK